MKKIEFEDMFFEIIDETVLVITIPEIFKLKDIEDMKISNNLKSIHFKFDETVSNKNNYKHITKIQLNNRIIDFLKSDNKEKKIYIIDINELKKQTKGLFYLYEI